MREKWILIVFTIISLLLLVGSILFQFLNEEDPYQFYTGLGKDIDISPDDGTVAFSYYLDGDEAIYTAKLDGSELTKVSSKEEGRFRNPKFSQGTEQLLFLSEGIDGVQSLMVMNKDGSHQKRVTDDSLHVKDAVFSPSGETLYFTAKLSSEINKMEGETKEGYDLYKINRDETDLEQLTDQDHFTMNELSISVDGEELYYSLYEVNEQLTAFSLKDQTETRVADVNKDMYSSILSKDKKLLAYTAVTKASLNSSLFKYELYLQDLDTTETKRLTNLNKNIQSPVFFHHENKLAFLEYTNWPSDPENYRLMTVSFEGGDEQEINVNLPSSTNRHLAMKTVYFLLSNEVATAIYYVLFFVGLILLTQRRSGKVFQPSFISLGLSLLFFIGSFAIGAITNPWYGIWLAMVAVAMFICSLVLVLFSYIVSKMRKK
ncbi:MULTISPECIES: TolB family protein [Bacillaceae]|uniref:TolB family protein n=1 Tax=Bacillaceae TaxID=186817 RepID=UPI00159BAF86|nr:MULTISPECIES: DUF5050 domain-containing protein [Bacillaceae]UGB30858.1 DUF5050 domain-containing protein [Metabacillus sp. B2-18]